MRSRRERDVGSGSVIAVLMAAITLGVVGVVGWYVLGQSEPTPWNKPATVDGALVRISYTGSECQDSAEVDVVEESTQVVITIRETVRARSCSDVGVPYDVEVLLDAPLADRSLVDGACQIQKYANYLDCATNKSTVEPGNV